MMPRNIQKSRGITAGGLRRHILSQLQPSNALAKHLLESNDPVEGCGSKLLPKYKRFLPARVLLYLYGGALLQHQLRVISLDPWKQNFVFFTFPNLERRLLREVLHALPR
jgi:hypothetical protein